MSSPIIEIRRHSAASPWTYAALDRRQREIARDLLDVDFDFGPISCPGALLISEVAPVITVGRRTPAADLLFSETALALQGIALERVDRGGLATYHGPGQWVVFAVDRLESLTGDRRGVRRAVGGLLEIALAVGCAYDPTAEIREGIETGVWTKRGKFASVGVHVEQGVLLHGLAINGFRTPTSFTGLRPCGLEPHVDFLLDRDRRDAAADDSLDSEFHALGDRIRGAALRTFWQENARPREASQG